MKHYYICILLHQWIAMCFMHSLGIMIILMMYIILTSGAIGTNATHSYISIRAF